MWHYIGAVLTARHHQNGQSASVCLSRAAVQLGLHFKGRWISFPRSASPSNPVSQGFSALISFIRLRLEWNAHVWKTNVSPINAPLQALTYTHARAHTESTFFVHRDQIRSQWETQTEASLLVTALCISVEAMKTDLLLPLCSQTPVNPPSTGKSIVRLHTEAAWKVGRREDELSQGGRRGRWGTAEGLNQEWEGRSHSSLDDPTMMLRQKFFNARWIGVTCGAVTLPLTSGGTEIHDQSKIRGWGKYIKHKSFKVGAGLQQPCQPVVPVVTNLWVKDMGMFTGANTQRCAALMSVWRRGRCVFGSHLLGTSSFLTDAIQLLCNKHFVKWINHLHCWTHWAVRSIWVPLLLLHGECIFPPFTGH